MALSKYASDETRVPKWQIALAVGGTLVAGAGIYYFLLRSDSGKGKAPKTKPKKTTDSVDTSSHTSTAELEKADDTANQREKLSPMEQETLDEREKLSPMEQETLDKALFYAAHRGDIDEVNSKIASGAAVDGYTDDDGFTALMEAARGGHLSRVSDLMTPLQHRKIFYDRFMALMEAAYEGHLSCVSDLMTAGADVNHVSNSGRTALWVASFSGRLDVVQHILADGRATATINKPDGDGETPLQAAKRNGHTTVVEALSYVGGH